MKPKPLSESHLADQVYSFPKWPKILWILFATIPFFLGLLFYLPVKSSIENALKKQSMAMNCPLRYERMDTELFLPQIIFRDLSISGNCFQSPGMDLQLDEAKLNFRGLSFYPFGPKFLVEIKAPWGNVNLYQTLSFRQQKMKLEDTEFKLNELTTLFDLPRMEGTLTATALIGLDDKEGLTSLDLLLKSKNFVVSPQNIQGLLLPNLPIHNFLAKASLTEKNRVQFNQVIIGDDQSPIIAQFSGEMVYNPQHLASSNLDLKGGVKFSANFLKDFSILNLFLNRYQQKDGFYQIKISGPLGHPSFSPL